MLGREGQTLAGDALELGVVVRDAAAGAAQGERRADDHGVPQLGHDGACLVEGVGHVGAGDLEADVGHRAREELAVLAGADGLQVAADDLDAVAVEHPCLAQGHRAVEGRLAAHVGEKGVGALALDHALDRARRDRLDVGAVGGLGVGHDRGRVGVDEHDLVALAAKRAAGLGAGVVELAGLADHDGAGADDEDLLDVGALGH